MSSFTLNEIRILGHVGADPENITTKKGSVMTTFNVATNNNYKNGSDEWITETTWHRVQAFDINENVLNNIKKGTMVYVVGRFENKKIEDKWYSYISPNIVKVVNLGKKEDSKPTSDKNEFAANRSNGPAVVDTFEEEEFVF